MADRLHRTYIMSIFRTSLFSAADEKANDDSWICCRVPLSKLAWSSACLLFGSVFSFDMFPILTAVYLQCARGNSIQRDAARFASALQPCFILYTNIPIYIYRHSYLFVVPPHSEDKVESVDIEITVPMIETLLDSVIGCVGKASRTWRLWR
jgi:hypothetical protein